MAKYLQPFECANQPASQQWLVRQNTSLSVILFARLLLCLLAVCLSIAIYAIACDFVVLGATSKKKETENKRPFNPENDNEKA